uniref:Erythrocyte membrane protein band 4.1 like 4A n=1 Tax=Salvator merianae TaxID=96440 RepID=A0A8D0B737_SALMN
MGCFCAVQEEFYCEVLLLDESKLTLTSQQQGIKKSTKGSVVLGYVFRHLNLVEIDYFGLRYCDRSHQTYWLDPAKTLTEHKELINTGPPYTLYFGVKFYAEDPCKLKEEITRSLELPPGMERKMSDLAWILQLPLTIPTRQQGNISEQAPALTCLDACPHDGEVATSRYFDDVKYPEVCDCVCVATNFGSVLELCTYMGHFCRGLW